MKTSFTRPLVLAFALVSIARAQDFSIPWFTLNGSGGASSGGGFALAGSPASVSGGPSIGDGFSVVGGVWSLAAVVTSPDAPLLRLRLTAGGIVLAWPQPSDGFQLQASSSLTTPVWSNVLASPASVGAENQVTLPAEPGRRFFRLHKP